MMGGVGVNLTFDSCNLSNTVSISERMSIQYQYLSISLTHKYKVYLCVKKSKHIATSYK